jgi:hypothetical protein
MRQVSDDLLWRRMTKWAILGNKYYQEGKLVRALKCYLLQYHLSEKMGFGLTKRLSLDNCERVLDDMLL